MILDFLQFCYKYVTQPIQNQDRYHPFLKHYHLMFDQKNGQDDFREFVNFQFARNGVAFEISQNGEIARVIPLGLKDELNHVRFDTPDATLNTMLSQAISKYLNPDPSIRKEAIERLWDSWERLKTLRCPQNKRQSIYELLDEVTDEPLFRDLIEKDADELTKVGNNFQIRHFEIGKQPIEKSTQVDYLFHRMMSLIHLVISTMKK
jgi:hypothetical protein